MVSHVTTSISAFAPFTRELRPDKYCQTTLATLILLCLERAEQTIRGSLLSARIGNSNVSRCGMCCHVGILGPRVYTCKSTQSEHPRTHKSASHEQWSRIKRVVTGKSDTVGVLADQRLFKKTCDARRVGLGLMHGLPQAGGEPTTFLGAMFMELLPPTLPTLCDSVATCSRPLTSPVERPTCGLEPKREAQNWKLQGTKYSECQCS